MASPSTIRSPYEIRVALVADTITAHSPLAADAAHALAVRILETLNAIPEKVR
ncbi:hypothetical protein GR927_23210 [Mycolicibacterium sp. 3033]|nr:hypothetical protein [Mycolicibacterium aurantiacum]